jgi:hypothetical protein
MYQSPRFTGCTCCVEVESAALPRAGTIGEEYHATHDGMVEFSK